MEFVYVVIENGVVYPSVYTNYAAAVKVVNDKHKEQLTRQVEENPEFKDEILGEVNPKENSSGKTSLYIEKEINIEISKLPIRSSAGGSRKNTRKRR
jgi:hypothetical protein